MTRLVDVWGAHVRRLSGGPHWPQTGRWLARGAPSWRLRPDGTSATGETFWDSDLAGPGTRTIWDLLPDELKIDGLARVIASRWLAAANPGRWLGKAFR